MLWPTRQLKFGHRYIVAMRNLVTAAQSLVAPSDAFRALRDGVATSDPDIENRRDLYVVRVLRRGSVEFFWPGLARCLLTGLGKGRTCAYDATHQDIFAILADAGVERSSLQLAWEFTTGSLEYTTGWLTSMRDDANTRIPADGPAV